MKNKNAFIIPVLFIALATYLASIKSDGITPAIIMAGLSYIVVVKDEG